MYELSYLMWTILAKDFPLWLHYENSNILLFLTLIKIDTDNLEDHVHTRIALVYEYINENVNSVRARYDENPKSLVTSKIKSYCTQLWSSSVLGKFHTRQTRKSIFFFLANIILYLHFIIFFDITSCQLSNKIYSLLYILLETFLKSRSNLDDNSFNSNSDNIELWVPKSVQLLIDSNIQDKLVWFLS